MTVLPRTTPSSLGSGAGLKPLANFPIAMARGLGADPTWRHGDSADKARQRAERSGQVSTGRSDRVGMRLGRGLSASNLSRPTALDLVTAPTRVWFRRVRPPA